MIQSAKNRGFTVMEMMVVIAIIGAMATAALSAFQIAREKARDAIRVTDVSNIVKALMGYELQYGNWIETGYGANDGNGYINVSGSGPSVAQRLYDTGYLERLIVDPTGAVGSDAGVNYNGYMKYHCPVAPGTPSRVYVYARLESIPLSSSATDDTCCPDCDSNYNMNYYHLIPISN